MSSRAFKTFQSYSYSYENCKNILGENKEWGGGQDSAATEEEEAEPSTTKAASLQSNLYTICTQVLGECLFVTNPNCLDEWEPGNKQDRLCHHPDITDVSCVCMRNLPLHQEQSTQRSATAQLWLPGENNLVTAHFCFSVWLACYWRGCWSLSQLSRGEGRGSTLDTSPLYRSATLDTLTYNPCANGQFSCQFSSRCRSH